MKPLALPLLCLTAYVLSMEHPWSDPATSLSDNRFQQVSRRSSFNPFSFFFKSTKHQKAKKPKLPKNAKFSLQNCPDKCSYRGVCVADTSKKKTLNSAGLESYPFVCKCNKGYYGFSCEGAMDKYSMWYESEGKSPFPKCCNVDANQFKSPDSDARVYAGPPDDSNCLASDATCSNAGNLAAFSLFLEQESKTTISKRSRKFLPFFKSVPSLFGVSSQLKSCCVYCPPTEPSLVSSPPVSSGLFLELESLRESRSTKRKIKASAIESVLKGPKCVICPVVPRMVSDAMRLKNENMMLLKSMIARPIKSSTSVCCNVCPSQYSLNIADIRDPKSAEGPFNNY